MAGTANSLKTTFQNTSGKTTFFSFIGLHGITLAAGDTYTQSGDPYHFIRRSDVLGRQALENALTSGILSIVSTPSPVYTDTVTGEAQVLAVQGGQVAAVFPSWGPTDDVAGPYVTVAAPANGAKSVAAGTTIAITFSEAVTGTNIAVTTGGSAVSGSTAASAGNTVYTFTPGAALTGGGVYSVTVSGAVDSSNATMAPYTLSFSVAPQISSVTPANNATGQLTSVTPAVVFGEAVTGVSLTLSQGSTAVPGTVAISNASKTWTFSPTSALTAGKTYTVKASGGVDSSGNVQAAFTSTFST